MNRALVLVAALLLCSAATSASVAAGTICVLSSHLLSPRLSGSTMQCLLHVCEMMMLVS